MSDEELKSLLDAMRQESTFAHADMRRHFDVAMEATRHEIRSVAEAIAHVDEKLDRKAAGLDEKIERTQSCARNPARISAAAGLREKIRLQIAAAAL